MGILMMKTMMKTTIIRKIVKLPILVFSMYFLISSLGNVFSEDQTVLIPFGAFDPSFDTPTENWYEPPAISIQKGDTVTWTNIDREGHTVTSGEGPGRFEWMGDDKFGEPTGYFESGRFMKGDSWSFTFNEEGIFSYFCTIHPWMEGVVIVGESIPDYPHDASGNKIEKFPLIEITSDGLVELDLTWEPHIIKTNEIISFVYQTYDPFTNSNLDKMNYDFILIQNGKEVFRDEGLTQIGGDYRKYIFEEPGTLEIRFENIQSWGTSEIQSIARVPVDDPSLRSIMFTTIVYENPDKLTTDEIVIQPAKRLELQYEILVAIIVVPSGLAVVAVVMMVYGKGKAN